MVVFIAELNDGLNLWATDIGNAYLETEMTELIYIIAGLAFDGDEGHIFVIHKALSGLWTSGLHWHEWFADWLSMIYGFHSLQS